MPDSPRRFRFVLAFAAGVLVGVLLSPLRSESAATGDPDHGKLADPAVLSPDAAKPETVKPAVAAND